jgi:hypothetical protein
MLNERLYPIQDAEIEDFLQNKELGLEATHNKDAYLGLTLSLFRNLPITTAKRTSLIRLLLSLCLKML